tara:strand:+ start:196 stop:570 length:375 start_codon:yes stop_codon:yes gene_type:complete
MSYHVVTTYATKLNIEVQSDGICCSERRLIKILKHDFLKKGYKNHQFKSWLNRKCGTLIIHRKTSFGNGISLPCILCRKMIDKYNLKWVAYDGEKWIHSCKTTNIPKSRPTNKQVRVLGFSLNN